MRNFIPATDNDPQMAGWLLPIRLKAGNEMQLKSLLAFLAQSAGAMVTVLPIE